MPVMNMKRSKSALGTGIPKLKSHAHKTVLQYIP